APDQARDPFHFGGRRRGQVGRVSMKLHQVKRYLIARFWWRNSRCDANDLFERITCEIKPLGIVQKSIVLGVNRKLVCRPFHQVQLEEALAIGPTVKDALTVSKIVYGKVRSGRACYRSIYAHKAFGPQMIRDEKFRHFPPPIAGCVTQQISATSVDANKLIIVGCVRERHWHRISPRSIAES